MSLPINLPEHYKVVVAGQIAAANGVTYDTISCKDAHKVWFIVMSSGSSDTDQVLSLVESTDVADGSTAAVTGQYQHWKLDGRCVGSPDGCSLVHDQHRDDREPDGRDRMGPGVTFERVRLH